MAKAIKVPTLQEMQEYRRLVSADPIHNYIDGLDHITMLKEMTQRIFAVDMLEDVKLTAWKFCKAVANCSHAPVSAADYRKMEKWLGEKALIDVLLEACEGYCATSTSRFSFDTIGYSYAIALLSQSQYRRQDCLDLLDRATQYFVSSKEDWYEVLLRNMKVLAKSYPDLVQFKIALESI